MPLWQEREKKFMKEKIENLDLMVVKYQSTKDILDDVSSIIESARKYAYQSVNVALVERNWLIGRRIAEEELKGKDRADYGMEVIKKLSKELKEKYGKGFTKTNLYYFFEFYKMFSTIFHAVRGKFQLLSWTHYRVLLQVFDKEARDWYEKEAVRERWSYRTLQRNIDTQYYYRLLKSQMKEPVVEEMKEKNKSYYLDTKLEFIKNPVIAEFLGYPLNSKFSETELETSIINNLQKFIMELGKGYAFVARQQNIHTEKEDYYIDLVFYNYILKCFVLIDLKTKKITHQDVGQMDMYVRMYDDLKKSDEDNPTIGILLCSETDEDIARYSVLNDSEQLYATKYKTYLPTKEELLAEIKSQRAIFEMQKYENKNSENDLS